MFQGRRLLLKDELHLTKTGKSTFGHYLANLVRRALWNDELNLPATGHSIQGINSKRDGMTLYDKNVNQWFLIFLASSHPSITFLNSMGPQLS